MCFEEKMARNSSTVYLGFEDDAVNEKNKFLVNFATNKVGGQPVSTNETNFRGPISNSVTRHGRNGFSAAAFLINFCLHCHRRSYNTSLIILFLTIDLFMPFYFSRFALIQNWPSSEILIPPCSICGLKRPLLLQIYAPLDNSQFHRTLYIFSCVNAVCSNQSNGWLCVRVQQMEKVIEKDATKVRATVPNINWCSGANDWDESDDIYTGDADNSNEQNGNVIRNDNR